MRNIDVPSSILIDMTTYAHVSSATIQTNKDKVLIPNSKNVGSICKPLTKGKCLTTQTKSTVAMTKILEGSNEARDNLLAARHRISNA